MRTWGVEWELALGYGLIRSSLPAFVDTSAFLSGVWMSLGPVFRFGQGNFSGFFWSPKVQVDLFWGSPGQSEEYLIMLNFGYSWRAGRLVVSLTAGVGAGYGTSGPSDLAQGLFTTSGGELRSGFILGCQADLLRIGFAL